MRKLVFLVVLAALLTGSVAQGAWYLSRSGPPGYGYWFEILDPVGYLHPYNGPDLRPGVYAPGAVLFYADLAYADLYQANLTTANLYGANLAYADLHYGDLYLADLTGADLTGADLRYADLTFAGLPDAVLTGANLTGATLTGVYSGGITGTPAYLPSNWLLRSGYLVGPGADLLAANLQYANLYGANLGGADLYGANLTGANLTFAGLPGADLTLANLTGATLTGVYSGGITGTPAYLPSNWLLRSGYLVGPGADLLAANLQYANLYGANLGGADLYGANLTGANLTFAGLPGADLTLANLTGATLTGVYSGGITGTPAYLPSNWLLRSGYLVGPGADLLAANLQYANLYGANLGGADLYGANLTGANLTFAGLPGADLTGANLTGATLTGVYSGGITGTPAYLPSNWLLRSGYLVGPGADLLAANLQYANLYGANLGGADLYGANLTGADLTFAGLPGADLTGANLTGATLTGVYSGGITGTPAYLPSNWLLRSGYLVGPGADLLAANLQYANLYGANLTGADLYGANLTGADLTFAGLPGADLTLANLTGATLTGVYSGGITGTPAYLPSNWLLRSGYLVGPGADLLAANLQYANLYGANLTGADLYGANLTGADLTFAGLPGADLTLANLTGATLTGVYSGGITGTPAYLPSNWLLRSGYLVGPGADLLAANLQYANLYGANLGGANLGGANLTGADLTFAGLPGADLTGANLTGATLTGVYSGGITGTPAYLPSNWLLRSGYLVGPGANLSGATLVSKNLTNTNLTNANLTGANLNNANLTGANLKLAFLAGANLTSANLDGANLWAASLTGANLANVNLTGATLDWVFSGEIVGNPAALPASWQLTSGYLVGPKATLSGASLENTNLSNANLFEARLTGANLANTNLTGATLDRVVSGEIVGNPAALPTSWQLTSGYLVGPKADLSSANLPSANLTGAPLDSANLYDANLTNSQLANADLRYANLYDADLTGADLSHTKLGSTNLANANLAGANLSYANLWGANLDGAQHLNSTSGSPNYYPNTKLPPGFNPVARGWTSTPFCDFSGDADCDVQDLDLLMSDLEEVDLLTPGEPDGSCSGTLISPTFVLTAAHCAYKTPSDPSDQTRGQPLGDTDGTFEIGGKSYATSKVTVHPNYARPVGNDASHDIALFELSQAVTGITPSPIFTGTPQVGDVLTLVGFGEGGTGDTGGLGDFGTKRMGTTPIDDISSTLIWWNFDNNTESNTAHGDSGGPAFLLVDGVYRVAGVTSGGEQPDAAIGDTSYNTRVDFYENWIAQYVDLNEAPDGSGPRISVPRIINGTPIDSSVFPSVGKVLYRFTRYSDPHDLNSDGTGNLLDITEWLSQAATANGYNSPYLPGDTDLDRDVDLSDYNKLATNFDPVGSQGPHGWNDGNFDADNDVDLSDYNALAAGFNPAGYGAAAVPEPTSALLALLGMLLFSVFGRSPVRLASDPG